MTMDGRKKTPMITAQHEGRNPIRMGTGLQFLMFIFPSKNPSCSICTLKGTHFKNAYI